MNKELTRNNELIRKTELTRNKLLNSIIFENDIKANVYFADIQFIPIQMSNGIKLIQIIEGEIKVKISFNSYRLVPGDFLLINSYELHSMESITQSNKILVVELDMSLLENRLFAFDIYFYRNFNLEIVDKVKRLMKLACKAKTGADEVGNGSIIEIVREISDICDQYFQIQKYCQLTKTVSPFSNHSLHNGRMKQTYEYIYINAEDSKRLDTLSDMMNIDKCYASRLIKTGTGESFQEMLNVVRVDRAELLLLGTNLTIQNISEHLNFSTTYYFNKAFKHYFGMSPQAYRKTFESKTFPAAPSVYTIIKYGGSNGISGDMPKDSRGGMSSDTTWDMPGDTTGDMPRDTTGDILIGDIIKYAQDLYSSFQKSGEEIIEYENYRIMFDSRENSVMIADLSNNIKLKMLIPLNNIKNQPIR